MNIIDGKKIAQSILNELKQQVSGLPFRPLFCDVLVGSDPVSASYVRMKGKKAEKIGMEFKFAQFPENISQSELIEEIHKLNKLVNMCGLIVQLPLPAHLDRQEILNAINPEIDVDCMGEVNEQKFYAGQIDLPPPTAAAIMAIIDKLNSDFSGKKFLVIGQGKLVGKPVTFLLKQRAWHTDIATRSTQNFPELMACADVIVSATGKAGLVTGQQIKPGCIIIDAGTSESNGSIVGDVDMESVAGKAAYVSPVPGGVGPVTVSKLLQNVLTVAKQKTGNIILE